MKLFLNCTLLLLSLPLFAQQGGEAISEAEVSRLLNTLCADSMQGRHALRGDGIIKAAAFVAREFGYAGLSQMPEHKGYEQVFGMYTARVGKAEVWLDGESISADRVFCQTSDTQIRIDEQSGYELTTIEAGDNFLQKVRNLWAKTNNLLVWVDTAHSSLFRRISGANQPRFAEAANQVYVLTPNTKPKRWKLQLNLSVDTLALKNIVGVIPGKSKPEEYVVFSAHYDHIGIGKPNEKGDSIYNGANDDASGTTAVVMLARYFASLPPPERTLVFAAFTAEEVGGYGSQYFSRRLQPDRVVAMFNIEMIGTDSKWGLNSAYIKGYDKSDMGAILQKNLIGTGFSFHPDPYPQLQLFYRSDNATLARLGVPAHTISTSKMDSEPHYHKPSDEASTLDIKNMTAIIRAIALSSRSIASGIDAPTRVQVDTLQR